MLLINAVNAAGRPVELFVKDGKIAAVGQDLSALAGEGETVLDAGGLTVLPAFVDLHCHWRTPGFEYKEDVETGSRAAAAGGYTFVNLMPNTKPVCSSAAQAAMVEQKAAEVGLCDVNQTVSITEDFDGKTIDHLKTLPASVRFITEDGHGVQDNATMARAFAICTQRDITVMSHAEDMEISPWDYRLAEDLETVRNCWLSEYYQTRLHMCHVSTRGALEAIQMAKLRGAPVTCEVTPHHLWFTNDTCDYRVNPPIRTADDVQAVVIASPDFLHADQVKACLEAGKHVLVEKPLAYDSATCAEVIAAHQTRVSRIETGHVSARPLEIRALLDAYGVHDVEVRQKLEELARQSKRRGWWLEHAAHLRPD